MAPSIVPATQVPEPVSASSDFKVIEVVDSATTKVFQTDNERAIQAGSESVTETTQSGVAGPATLAAPVADPCPAATKSKPAPRHFKRVRALRDRMRRRHQVSNESEAGIATGKLDTVSNKGEAGIATSKPAAGVPAPDMAAESIPWHKTVSIRTKRRFHSLRHRNKETPETDAGAYETTTTEVETSAAQLPVRRQKSTTSATSQNTVFTAPTTSTLATSPTAATPATSVDISRVNKEAFEEIERLKEQLCVEQSARAKAETELAEMRKAREQTEQYNTHLKEQLEEEKTLTQKLYRAKKKVEQQLEEKTAQSAAHVKESFDLGVRLAEQKRDAAHLRSKVQELQSANSGLSIALVEQVEAARAAQTELQRMGTVVHRLRAEYNTEKLAKEKLYVQLVNEANDKIFQLGHAHKVIMNLKEQLRRAKNDVKVLEICLEEQSHASGVQLVKDRQEVAALERRLAAVYAVNRQLNDRCAQKELLGRHLPGDELVNILLSSEAGRLQGVIRHLKSEYHRQIKSMAHTLRGLKKRIAFLEKISDPHEHAQDAEVDGSVSESDSWTTKDDIPDTEPSVVPSAAAGSTGDNDVGETKERCCGDPLWRSAEVGGSQSPRPTTSGSQKSARANIVLWTHAAWDSVAKGRFLRRYLRAIASEGVEKMMEDKHRS